MQLKEYSQLNQSFEKVLVFHFGSRAGFFSEYNTMLQAMIYCLQHRIRFEMYSADANCSIKRGWCDFFEPFCKERTSPLHYAFNTRSPSPGLKFWLRKNLGGPLLRAPSKCDYLTYDLWNSFRSQSENTSLEIPHIPWSGSLRELCKALVAISWRFTPEINALIEEEKARIQIPGRYVGVHIRAGDKIKEYHVSPPESYIEKLSGITDIKDVVVMTDDYRIFEKLCQDFKDYNFHTLETHEQQGYNHRKNQRKSSDQKREDYIRLFAGVELMAQSEHFVGTFSSSLGVFLGMRMDDGKCHAVDANQWKIL